MELIVILIIFVTAFVIAVNTRKKHVSMENNVSPNNIPSEDGQFKYENRLSIISGFILFINILGSIALLMDMDGFIYLHLLQCYYLHFYFTRFSLLLKKYPSILKRRNKK